MLSFRARRAAVLLWILVTIAVIAAVAAATAPLLMQINDTERVAASAKLLGDVAHGVDSFNAVVTRGASSSPANTTPASLVLLTTSVTSGGIAGCSAQHYDTASVTGWTANGPFAASVMSPEGLWTPIGRLNDAPSRSPAAVQPRRAATDAYFIQIPGVDVKLARLIDVYVDGTANANADTVQYSSPARDSTVLLSYRVSLRHTPAC